MSSQTQQISLRICILEGPEYDSVGVETCCPKYIKNLMKFSV